MTIECVPGDIFVYLVPFLDKTKQKPRPVLVVSKPNTKGDVLVITGSSKLDKWNEPLQILVRPEDLEDGVLRDPTVFPCSKQLAASPKFFHTKIGRLTSEKLEETLRFIAARDASSFYETIHLPMQNKSFIPGNSRIPYAGRVFDEREVTALVDSSLDFWLTTGRYAERFEREFAAFLGVQHCSLVNSGSSANLLAFMALTSPKLGDRRIRPGDEVITVAAGFPTTVAPIIQYGAVPVFVDVSFPTYNIDVTQLDAALSDRTKAVMVAHTLGNPFDIAAVKAFCDRNNLWLIEDNCDALGSRYKTFNNSTPQLINDPYQYTGTFGNIGTSSFYPPHHMTMGEGGAVYTNDVQLKRIVESLRDWGRDCWCPSGKDNTCGNRFGQQFGELPFGYDHKYVYSHFGYNLKVTDMQAAIGCAQLEKLPGFIESRKRNWKLLRDGLAGLEDRLVLPEATENSDPSWFGFLLTVREGTGLTREKIVNHLESKDIQTRMLFAGNLIKHPCFDEMRATGKGFRVVPNTNVEKLKCLNVENSSPQHLNTSTPQHLNTSTGLTPLPITDRIMRDTFWVGVYPGMTEEMVGYMVETITGFCR